MNIAIDYHNIIKDGTQMSFILENVLMNLLIRVEFTYLKEDGNLEWPIIELIELDGCMILIC